MNSKGILLVGGPAAGQMHRVAVNLQVFFYEAPPEPQYTPCEPGALPKLNITHFEYRISPYPVFGPGKEPLYLATLDDNAQDASMKLVDEYVKLAKADEKRVTKAMNMAALATLNALKGMMYTRVMSPAEIYQEVESRIDHIKEKTK